MTEVEAERGGRISIAILALGGEGGGVLTDWIREVAASQGYDVQATSVAGVAQRTGSTIYYVEMAPRRSAGENTSAPVLALMPTPGDVDVVIASELMEGGRAMLRGFVTADRTTLITSTHRVYAISEKMVAGDGRMASEPIIRTAKSRAQRFVGFDMAAAADRSGTVISAVMFGALAGSGALPFSRSAFEDVIKVSGKSVASNLRGFAEGLDQAAGAPAPAPVPATPLGPTTETGRRLQARIRDDLPAGARDVAEEGVRRLLDYQGPAYAELYLTRLERVARSEDAGAGALTAVVARWLALWMAYEDVIRVADLKVRATRSERVAAEVRVSPGQVLTVTEYMHPRLREVCDILPTRLARGLLASRTARRLLEPFFRKGRHVRTTSLLWFLSLCLIGALRPLRPSSLRYGEEQARIEDWISCLESVARRPELALELAEAPRVLKGYGDTWDRSLERYERILNAMAASPDIEGAAARVREARLAALADDSDASCPSPAPLSIKRAPAVAARRAH